MINTEHKRYIVNIVGNRAKVDKRWLKKILGAGFGCNASFLEHFLGFDYSGKEDDSNNYQGKDASMGIGDDLLPIDSVDTGVGENAEA